MSIGFDISLNLCERKYNFHDKGPLVDQGHASGLKKDVMTSPYLATADSLKWANMWARNPMIDWEPGPTPNVTKYVVRRQSKGVCTAAVTVFLLDVVVLYPRPTSTAFTVIGCRCGYAWYSCLVVC